MTEKEFGERIKGYLKKYGYAVTRIESAATSSGIPDIFAMGNGKDFWIELKYLDKNFDGLKPGSFVVPWRRGQQAWATVYRNSHFIFAEDDFSIQCKVSFTVVGFKDAIVVIPMKRLFENNIVSKSDCVVLHLDAPAAKDIAKNFVSVVAKNTYMYFA